MSEIEICSLIVRFEREWEPRLYPYLGQTFMMRVAHQLLAGYGCKKPVEFSARFGTPEAQIKMGEVLQGDGNAADRLEDLSNWTPPPSWNLASHGWRTARSLQAALEAGGIITAGVIDIAAGLTAEVNDWVTTMEAAVEADIRFNVDLVPCPNPAEDLVLFVERHFAETAQLIREALEENGIEITE